MKGTKYYMKKINFCDSWFFKKLGSSDSEECVLLPHDAMIFENRSAEAKGMHNIGWFESYDYTYRKFYKVPDEYKNNKHILEFEGVYHNAEIYVNGQKVAYRPYGYTNFYVDITAFLNFDSENEIKVIARNADQPNSRWYSGSGIYRPVWLYVGQDQYVLPTGVKIETKCCNPAQKTALVDIKVATSQKGEVEISIFDSNNKLMYCDKNENGNFKVDLKGIDVWSVDTPVLYKCQVKAGADVVEENFGIRTIHWDADNGIELNGEHVVLKGACIHSDNGLLGACTYKEVEERKVKILKETGYNAIRCAHNPCSKVLLEACDELGMLVMDEYTDMWYIHKNQYDYASYMMDWWEKDLKDMVEKDFNHPSVILYSVGNEVAETGQKRGIELTGKMTEYLHGLDNTRPVTCGVNIFFNFLYSMGLGVYSDDKANKEAESTSKKKKTVGSEFYNTLAGLLGDKTMKFGATLHMCDVKTRDAYAAMDIAGYNYGIDRYKKDLKKYPDRLILGSETFCKDAYRFNEIAKKEARIVGDFVWAGMDYIGEAGIGAWEYEDYAPKNGDTAGWLTAGSGRINILGYPNGEAAYTKVALEKEKGPFIAVKPVYQRGKHSPSAWKMTDAIESWSWRGQEGVMATVEVYARASEVAILLNNKELKRKKLKNTCRAIFKIPYDNGKLTAVSYDENGMEIGRKELVTANHATKLDLIPEKDEIQKNKLGFIQLRYTDSNGIWKPMEKHNIKIKVENGELAGLGNACSYNKDGYKKDNTFTYYGEALAVVKATSSEKVKITVSDEDENYSIEIPVVD